MKRYILSKDGETPVESTNNDEWGVFMWNINNRRVALETINGITISTVFLGMDHNYFGGSPILWETMVFDEKVNYHALKGCGLPRSNRGVWVLD